MSWLAQCLSMFTVEETNEVKDLNDEDQKMENMAKNKKAITDSVPANITNLILASNIQRKSIKTKAITISKDNNTNKKSQSTTIKVSTETLTLNTDPSSSSKHTIKATKEETATKPINKSLNNMINKSKQKDQIKKINHPNYSNIQYKNVHQQQSITKTEITTNNPYTSSSTKNNDNSKLYSLMLGGDAMKLLSRQMSANTCKDEITNYVEQLQKVDQQKIREMETTINSPTASYKLWKAEITLQDQQRKEKMQRLQEKQKTTQQMAEDSDTLKQLEITNKRQNNSFQKIVEHPLMPFAKNFPYIKHKMPFQEENKEKIKHPDSKQPE